MLGYAVVALICQILAMASLNPRLFHDHSAWNLAVYASSFVTGFIIERWRSTYGITTAERLAEQLAEPAQPDQPFYTPRIYLKAPKSQYSTIVNVTGLRRGSEVILIAQQPGTAEYNHSFEAIRQQIMTYVNQVTVLNKGDPSKSTKIKWVCFTTKSGCFVAFQDFSEFYGDIVESRLNQIVDILNTPSETDFRVKLREWGEQKTKKTYVFHALAGVSFDSRIAGISNRDAICLLTSGAPFLMLVNRDCKPIGVLTIGGVAKTVLRGLINCKDIPPTQDTCPCVPEDFTTAYEDAARRDRLAAADLARMRTVS